MRMALLRVHPRELLLLLMRIESGLRDRERLQVVVAVAGTVATPVLAVVLVPVGGTRGLGRVSLAGSSLLSLGVVLVALVTHLEARCLSLVSCRLVHLVVVVVSVLVSVISILLSFLDALNTVVLFSKPLCVCKQLVE